MAQDPRYQRQSIQIADVPELRLSNLQETIKGSARLEQALDRVSATAFKEVSEQQQKRGMQYGLENAPSLEELSESVKSGITPAELFESDTTVFGKSAQKVQAKLVRAQLEYEARKDLTAVKELIKTGQIRTIEDLDSELNGIINGSPKYLSGVDVEESLGLRTSVLSRSREVRQYGVGKIVEAQQLLHEQELEDFILNTTDSWIDKIESMPIKNPDLYFNETMNDALAIINKSGFLGAAKQAKTIERVREMQQDTIMFAITNQYSQNPDFLKNPGKYINDVQRGIVGEYTDMYAALTPEKKKALQKDLRELYKQKYADEKFGYDLSVKDNIVELNALKDSLEQTQDPKQRNQIINQMRDISLKYPEVLSMDDIKKIKDDQYKVDPSIEFSPSVIKFKERIRKGEFDTWEEMNRTAKQSGHDDMTIRVIFAKDLASKQVRAEGQVIDEIVTEKVSTIANANKKKKEAIRAQQDLDAIKERDGDDFNLQSAKDEVKKKNADDKLQRKMGAALKDLKSQFEGFDAISDLYNPDYLNRDVEIDDPAVLEILKNIENEDEQSYKNIKEVLERIESIRKEMDNS